ncbi:MAG: signal peptidase II [Anaerolineae bacterium]
MMTENNNITTHPAYRWRILIFVAVGIFVVTLDQWTKWLITQNVPLNTSQAPFPDLYPYFQFSHVSNTGTAFGFLPQAKWVFTALAVVVTIGLVFYNNIERLPNWKLRIALGLLWGGAMGNLIDRFRIGHVTDFINFNLRPLLQPALDIRILDWAVFNIADLAISTGVVLLALHLWLDHEQINQAAAAQEVN